MQIMQCPSSKMKLRIFFCETGLPPQVVNIGVIHENLGIDCDYTYYDIFRLQYPENMLSDSDFNCTQYDFKDLLTRNDFRLLFSLLTAIVGSPTFVNSSMFCFPRRLSGVTTNVILSFPSSTAISKGIQKDNVFPAPVDASLSVHFL